MFNAKMDMNSLLIIKHYIEKDALYAKKCNNLMKKWNNKKKK